MDNSQLVADALLQTNPELYRQIDGGNSWREAISQRGARVRLYRKYERGDHRANITDQMRAMLRLTKDDSQLNDFNDNYMRIVIDKMAGRVFAQGLSTGDDATDKGWLQPMLAKQSFDSVQGMWWRGAIRDGDAFVMVDPETFAWTSEPAFDQFSGVVAIYDQMTRRPVWACKLWSESDIEDITGQDDDYNTSAGSITVRLVVYQPNQIAFYKGQPGTATVEPDGDNQSRPWPLGRVPLVTYANQRDIYTMYGESEIRPAIPLQDVLNRTLHSMVMASEFAAYPVNISVGLTVDPGGIVPGAIVNLVLKDGAGNAITDFSPEQIEFLKAAKVTQLAAADLGQYTGQIDRIVKEISQTTQTPIYGVTTTGAVSGDALKQLEVGLIGKAERFQQQNADALRELVKLTADMQRVFSPGLRTPKIETVNVIWRGAELLDVDKKIDVLSRVRKDNPGLFTDDFYRARIGALLGLSEEEIESEGAASSNNAALMFDRLVGAGGEVPVV
jgi:hypothetical protein